LCSVRLFHDITALTAFGCLSHILRYAPSSSSLVALSYREISRTAIIWNFRWKLCL